MATATTRRGSFKKGISGNPAGRPKGTPNKINERIRETIHAALDETSTDVVKWIRRLGKDDPKGALQVYAALAEFALPKLSRAEVKAETDGEVRHVIRFTRAGNEVKPGTDGWGG
jgi:hypothetical protein